MVQSGRCCEPVEVETMPKGRMRLPIEVVEESRPRKLEPKRVWTQHFCRPSHEYFRNRKSCIFILEVDLDLDLDLVEAVSLTSAWPEAEESHNTQEPWGK